MNTKRCSKCNEVKIISEFFKSKIQKSGFCSSCKLCAKQYNETISKKTKTIPEFKKCCRCHVNKSGLDFYINNRSPDGLSYSCTSCEKLRKAAKASQRSEYDRKRYENIRFEQHLKRKYNLTLQEYNQLLILQNNLCKICERLPEEGEILVVDHCHKTGSVRGMLCDWCNKGLGNFDDNPDFLNKAADYLRKSIFKKQAA